MAKSLTPQPPCLRMSVVDVAAGAAGTVVAGYLTGAAAGPAISSAAALQKGPGTQTWAKKHKLRTNTHTQQIIYIT